MQRANIALALAATLTAGCAEVQELLGDIVQGEGSGHGTEHGSGGGGPDTPPPPTSCGPTLGADDLYATIAADLASIDADDQPFQRYVTLANLANAGICDERLDQRRMAISELFNSLSNETTLELPIAIDADLLSFRVDLRNYGWDRALEVDGRTFPDGWEAAIAGSPFAIEYAGPDADDAKADSGTAVPLMNFDALADVTSESSLYYALVGVGGDSDELFEELGIDLDANRRDGASVLVGTTRSRISRANRILERNALEVRSGSIWRALDFLDESNVNVLSDPLSDANDGNVAFFTLPNGLLGFAIFDANGQRLDDSDILLDTNQNNFRAKVAGSCLNCHGSSGVIPAEDEVRAFVSDNPDALDPQLIADVERLYPLQPELDGIFARDARDYAAARALAGIVTTGADPLAIALLAFDADLDAAAMAGDLWVSQRTLAANLDDLPDPVRLPFADRDDFASAYADAACSVANTENRPVDCD